MRCPKCDYIGYDSTERCRNCGYDLSGEDVEAGFDPPLHSGDTGVGEMLAEFDARAEREREGRLDRLPPARRPAPDVSDGGDPDLPLFDDAPADSRLPRATPPPRAPLGVRRATAEIARPRPRSGRSRVEEPELGLEPPPEPAAHAPPARQGMSPSGLRRFASGLLDLALVAAVDAIVIYFTLQICGLTLSQITVLPVLPLASFFVILNGGYFVAFTAASGQTLGKMALGLRVVCHDGAPIDVAHAVLRTAAYLASVLPFGLGFVMSLFGREQLALHDRLAETRVVVADDPPMAARG